MSVAIRLTRKGRKKKPFYRVIAIDRRARRDGRPIEDLGWYDPFSKASFLNKEAIEKWVKLGAKLSDRVNIILGNKLSYTEKTKVEEKEVATSESEEKATDSLPTEN